MRRGRRLTRTIAKCILLLLNLNRSLFLLSPLGISIVPSAAKADSLEEVNTKLGEYSLPPIIFTPPGFSNGDVSASSHIIIGLSGLMKILVCAVVSEYGRGNIREEITNPLLVQFAYPNYWVVQKTTVNNNGEAGTISANGGC